MSPLCCHSFVSILFIDSSLDYDPPIRFKIYLELQVECTYLFIPSATTNNELAYYHRVVMESDIF